MKRNFRKAVTWLLTAALLITALLGMRPAVICNTAITLMVAALAAGGSEAYTETMVLLRTARRKYSMQSTPQNLPEQKYRSHYSIVC